MMEAIILAGGMGTRLRGVIKDVPKPMAPVNGNPFLYYIFNWLKSYPLKRVIISAGYKSESIREYFGKTVMDIPVSYAIEEKPLGTGGAIMNSLALTTEDNILILNGDTYFPFDPDRFFMFHSGNRNQVTIALKRMKDFSRYGSVVCSGNTVIKFNEKKYCSDGLINGGAYLVNREFLISRQIPGSFSFEKEILEKEAGSSLLKCVVFDDPFIDIGIPEDYLRAAAILKPDSFR